MRLRGASRRAPNSASGDACRSLFQPGDKVEVRTDEEGFRGAWHEAVILRSLPSCRRYEVSYVSLLSEEDPSKPLIEFVSRSHLRPTPPPAAGDGAYSLHARVEAFHNDGWWSGFVSGSLPAFGRYTVCIPTSREEINFGHWELRPQLHWVSSQRRWIPAEEMNHGKPKYKVGDIVEVSRDSENYGTAWFEATIVKAFDNSTFIVEYDNVRSHSNNEIVDIQYMRPGLLSAVAKYFTLGDEVEVLLDHGWSAGTVLEVLDDGEYIVELKHSKAKLKFDCSEMRDLRFWTGFHWVFSNKKASRRHSLPILSSASSDRGEIAQKHDADKWTETKSSSMRRRSEGTAMLSKSTNEISSVDSIGFGRNSVIPTELEIEKHISIPTVEHGSSMEEQHHSKSPTNPLPHGLVHRHKISNVNDISQLPPTNQELSESNRDGLRHEAETLVVNDNLVPIEHNDCIPIAKWSNSKCSWASKATIIKRRKRLVVGDPKRRKLALDNGSRKQSLNQIIGKTGYRPQDMCISGMNKFDPCDLENPQNSLAVVESENGRKNNDLNQGVIGDLTESDDTNISTTSRQVGLVYNVSLTPHIESPVSSSDLMNSLASRPSDTIASPCEDNSLMTAMHEDLARNKSPEVLSVDNRRALLDLQPSSSPPKKAPLLFVKNSMIWESIESMDIFRKIPQEPHFRCLEEHSVDFREGMAVGLMISFANLVSNIEKLSISEDPTTLKEKLRSLEALEANGFNVACIKVRLKELLQLQVSQTEIKSKKAMLEAKMVEIRDDCDMINETITSYDKAIEALEGNIARIREKKDSVLKLKEGSESALVKFKKEAHEAEEVCRSAEERFITKLATPW